MIGVVGRCCRVQGDIYWSRRMNAKDEECE